VKFIQSDGQTRSGHQAVLGRVDEFSIDDVFGIPMLNRA
jgi:hypothetical protein